MNIGLIAHDTKKTLIQNFCIAYRATFAKHNLYATGTTGRAIEDAYSIIKSAAVVIFIGKGVSGEMARCGVKLFCDAGKFSTKIDESFLSFKEIYLGHMVTVVISESGETPNTIAVAKQFKEIGGGMITAEQLQAMAAGGGEGHGGGSVEPR